MSAWERELGTLPSPICPCSTERSGRDLLFLVIVLVLLLVLVIENIEFEDDDEPSPLHFAAPRNEDDKEQTSSCAGPKLLTILTHKNN